MVKEKEIAEKLAGLRESMPISDGGHIITGAQSIFEAPSPKIARFDLNENLFGASPKTTEAIKSFVQNVGVHWYNAWMRRECEEAIAKHVGCKPENVFVCNGSAETLVLIGQCFLEPGDELIAEYPTYRVLPNYTKVYGCGLVEVLQERGFSAERLPQKMIDKIGPKTKMIYLCNPTTFAAKVPKTEIIRLLERTQKPPQPTVIIDEAYYDSATYPFSNETAADLIEKYPNLIVVRTFSKSFALAGLRIGYAITCKRNVVMFNKLFSPLGVSSPAYVGAIAALNDLNYYDDVRKKIEENRKYLTSELTKLGIEVFPSCANFMLARFPPGILNDDKGKKGVWTRLVENGIYLRNKSVMYAGTDLCHDMVRITIGKREDCERFIRELKEIVSSLGSLGRAKP
ncbi:aminotransferase class I/II-fold pyridoxal phosphate-dependent enzyme [Candidatus Bathyarchaeota archaeon]|jgi:histidinol-phosphate aminotransferase|nr:aminotransferase class I/II-fold pyridoxal phosphate-dependent enzyme [Candidatus Bathyarchaeota archaeon]